MKVSVIGAGSWGSAFARYLGRQELAVRIWVREEEILRDLAARRENRTFLPGFRFPRQVGFTGNLKEAVLFGDVLFIAVPSQYCRSVYTRIAPFLQDGQTVVSLTKGLELRSLKRMSQIMEEVFRPHARTHLAVLSGPSFARDVAAGHPTALVVASRDFETARMVQHLISSLTIRVYTSSDVTGVEIAGALKNVIAIAAGICDALDFGLNSRAALITRGLVEITELGLSLGAVKKTFSGLAGVGDLVLTCTGELSRNRSAGLKLAAVQTLEEIVGGMRMVAEGIKTTRAAVDLARRHGIDMPITQQVCRMLFEGKPAREAIRELMERSLKGE